MEKDKDKVFDNVSDNFKKICTDNGIDTDAAQKFLLDIMELVPEEKLVDFTAELIFSIVIWGTRNGYEALGMLEATKIRYDRMLMEMDEDDDE